MPEPQGLGSGVPYVFPDFEEGKREDALPEITLEDDDTAPARKRPRRTPSKLSKQVSEADADTNDDDASADIDDDDNTDGTAFSASLVGVLLPPVESTVDLIAHSDIDCMVFSSRRYRIFGYQDLIRELLK